jgi:hypothetical protein
MHEKDTPIGSSAQAVASRRAPRWRGVARAGMAVAAQGTLAGALMLAGSPAFAAAGHHAAPHAMVFADVVNPADPTFNQLLGINSHNVIAGYFGAGGSVHPNKGYLVDPPTPPGTFVNENFPGSAQTQVTGIDNKGNTCGFWVTAGGTSHGFVEWNGVFASYNDPKTPQMKGSTNQLLGINNNGVAVGFHTDAAGNNHAYQVNQATGVFSAIKIPGDVSTQATGINNLGDIVGIGTDANNVTTSWLLHNGQLTTFQFPHGGSNTQALGINDHDEIVGSYDDASGVMHGFTLKSPLGPVSHWQTIDDFSTHTMPGTTVVNGVNDAGDLVGFYTDTAGNVTGMLVT